MTFIKIDLIVIILFFLSLLVISVWSYFRSKNSEDYFVAGRQLPWRLAGISHHVSGHSGAVFVAYAAVCYTHGFTMYMWWAFPVGIVIIASARIFVVYRVRLRKNFHIQSPLEYLQVRCNLWTQQVIAWAGVLLKVFDVEAKWAAIDILLHVVAGNSMTTGILVSGVVTLIYVTFGGLWGVIIADLIQFIVQVLDRSVKMDEEKRVSLNGSGGILAGAAKSLLENVETLINHKLATLKEAWEMASINVTDMLLKNDPAFYENNNDKVIFRLEGKNIVISTVIKNGKIVFEI